MYASVAAYGKRVLPRGFLAQNRETLLRGKALLAKVALAATRAGETTFLTYDELEALQRKYAHPSANEYRYDRDSVRIRGEQRAAEITGERHFDPGLHTRFLEIGCGDGMALAALAGPGRTLAGVDHVSDRFDPRAAASGVKLVTQSATRLPFGAAEFDVVFSYNAFEHFDDPAAVYAEALRVLAPGGLLIVKFGPLYHAVWGLHGYNSIAVPYCQHLFSPADMDAYCDRQALPRIQFSYVNRWPVGAFRRLFHSSADLVETLRYAEERDLNGIDLVLRYPECFKSKISEFDDLIVASIHCIQRKRRQQ
jgi:SAM-dependent methyltransferase